MIEFDDAKDRANRAKHGISLARAADMELDLVIIDDREDYGEPRYRAFGFIDGNAHCLAFTLRFGRVRGQPAFGAREKEMRRYAKQKQKDWRLTPRIPNGPREILLRPSLPTRSCRSK